MGGGAAGGAPGSISRQLQKIEDLAIDRIAQEQLCQLILTTTVDAHVLDHFVREAEEVRAGNAVLVVLDLIFDPLLVRLMKRSA